MADRKAEYRFRNGSVWDRIFFVTHRDLILDLAKRTETGVRPDGEAVNGARANLIEIGNQMALYTDYCEIPISQQTMRTREYTIPPTIANRIDYAVSPLLVGCWQNETWGYMAGRYDNPTKKMYVHANDLTAGKLGLASLFMVVQLK